MKLFVDYNTPVERNMLLAEIDPTEYKTRLDNEQAGLNRARPNWSRRSQSEIGEIRIGNRPTGQRKVERLDFRSRI